ncbi:hypothetical protein GCM10007216_18300 [Thalassobacillus devorans]|uniref:Uncharacterized protein n=1 Tax=Thalassobacillus devorans TaxID=279813 RepID=A0ABQ1P2X6_9BACI|nr:hypothetical protein [Thalassobacillus devorans]NIK28226.1 hypothetical protein [Thalassobacillus devorans]GGC87895.1 hypothetical protein GCM10007216_18300 [Thalassobacillus devorans]
MKIKLVLAFLLGVLLTIGVTSWMNIDIGPEDKAISQVVDDSSVKDKRISNIADEAADKISQRESYLSWYENTAASLLGDIGELNILVGSAVEGDPAQYYDAYNDYAYSLVNKCRSLYLKEAPEDKDLLKIHELLLEGAEELDSYFGGKSLEDSIDSYNQFGIVIYMHTMEKSFDEYKLVTGKEIVSPLD